MSSLNYARVPGFGDLPGDSANPNSPDYDSSHDEAVDERAEEIVDGWMRCFERFDGVLYDLDGFGDTPGFLIRDLHRLSLLHGEERNTELACWLDTVQQRVRDAMRPAAEEQAELELRRAA